MTDPVIARTAARERRIGARALEKLLDDECLSLTVRGVPLDPWEVWRSPRLRDRADRVLAANRATRDSARSAGFTPQPLGDTLRVKPNPQVPPGEAWLRDDRGRIVGRIENVG